MELVPLTPPPEQPVAVEPLPVELPASRLSETGAPPAAKPARLEVDAYLAKAAAEYRQGRVDQALWDDTAKQFDGDKQATVAAYLRVRARALKRKKSDEDAKRPQQESAAAAGAVALLAQPRVRIGLAGLAIGFTAVVGAWIAFPGAAPPPEPPVAESAVKAIPVVKAPSKPAPISQVASTSARGEAVIELEAKVRSLENAANWNVLVLYAAEWTRKEPESAPAWTSLSGGYRRLGQLDDALDAARRAVKLAPASLHAWRSLGYVEIALERFPEARSAFDTALGVNGEDADALCGAARVASAQSRAKDAAELMSRVARTGTRCEDTPEAMRSAVYAGASRKSSPPAR